MTTTLWAVVAGALYACAGIVLVAVFIEQDMSKKYALSAVVGLFALVGTLALSW